MKNDTIAAIATAPGQGGVGIVRISGPEAERIMMALFRPARAGLSALPTHLLTYGHVCDGVTDVDECMAVLMRAPRSYTREDVAELQLHGGGYACQRVLALCLREGARLAEPGEFTRRAFLSGRIDLSQAEAVMNLIAARGEQAHRAAMHQLEGGASQFIRQAAEASSTRLSATRTADSDRTSFQDRPSCREKVRAASTTVRFTTVTPTIWKKPLRAHWA